MFPWLVRRRGRVFKRKLLGGGHQKEFPFNMIDYVNGIHLYNNALRQYCIWFTLSLYFELHVSLCCGFPLVFLCYFIFIISKRRNDICQHKVMLCNVWNVFYLFFTIFVYFMEISAHKNVQKCGGDILFKFHLFPLLTAFLYLTNTIYYAG